MKSITKIITLSMIALSLVACSSTKKQSIGSKFPSYKTTITQGNEVKIEDVQRLQLGMSKEQIRQIIGTPLLTDTFHADRWDYVYANTKNGKILEKTNLTLHFQGDVLEEIEGNPEESNYLDNKTKVKDPSKKWYHFFKK